MTEENATTDEQIEQDLTFEDALAKLEEYVRTLEQGELDLEQSLNIFEKGMKLAKLCGNKLDHAEQKIEILLEKNGTLVKDTFEIPEE